MPVCVDIRSPPPARQRGQTYTIALPHAKAGCWRSRFSVAPTLPGLSGDELSADQPVPFYHRSDLRGHGIRGHFVGSWWAHCCQHLKLSGSSAASTRERWTPPSRGGRSAQQPAHSRLRLHNGPFRLLAAGLWKRGGSGRRRPVLPLGGCVAQQQVDGGRSFLRRVEAVQLTIGTLGAVLPSTQGP
mgnify:CR=1 FL=1